MRIVNGQLTLSASDLANHLACPHLTSLNLAVARGSMASPTWRDPLLEVLRERGYQHEAAYLDHLRSEGRGVLELHDESDPLEALAQTRAAMDAGANVIVQAALADGRWRGRADVLLKVEGSGLGEWSYEVVDTKLARETRAGTILQLCLYSEMVASTRGDTPVLMHVVVPGRDFEPETYRADDYLAYYRFAKTRLEEAVDSDPGSATYPEPCSQCEICAWWGHCNRRRHDDDHLSLVAGISGIQRRELSDWGIDTLAQLAHLAVPLERRPARGSSDSLVKIREQARVQFEGRDRGEPVHELLPRETGHGLAALPDPSPGDVFLDLEGDPFAAEGGFVYLYGFSTTDLDTRAYQARWAFTSSEERAGFEWLVDSIMTRWEQYPGLHIYHFAPYEPSMLKRLMGRYATREDEVDSMLRGGFFIDLYAIVRRAIRAGVESYSIKELERFYGFERAMDLREASISLHGVERAIALGETQELLPEALACVEAYNRDDCLSNADLRAWLEDLRAQLVATGEPIERPLLQAPEPSDALGEWQQRVQDLKIRLAGDVPAELSERTGDQQARWSLSELLEWHRREDKAVWWECFRLRELPEEELLYERRAVYGLDCVGRFGGTDGCPIHRYHFPEQDFDIREGDDLYSGDSKVGTVSGVDSAGRTIDIKKTGACRDIHPQGVFAHKIISARVLQDSLFRVASWVTSQDAASLGEQTAMETPGSYRPARDLLLGHVPRVTLDVGTETERSLLLPAEDAVSAARRLVIQPDFGVLAIQGPPGAGKTYVGARMICDLLGAGRKVGVTAVGHKVIRNLLKEVVRAAEDAGQTICCIQKPGSEQPDDCPRIIHATGNEDALARLLQPGPKVVGGTAWLWSREDMFESVDVLFVDEAGQMSLADVVASSQAARNLVLLGDPQQLDQPVQGCHPEGIAVSALQHFLQGQETMPANRGLFLGETWRLHPDICAFTSELFYERRLASRPGLERQALVDGAGGTAVLVGSGLWLVPVEHEGNQVCCHEEVEEVARLVNLLCGGHWVDRGGNVYELRLEDILIVCPYNAQVAAVGDRVPGAKVGTVDKFQGQEAPVVIYSMASSSAEEAPRGMEFLYSPNRLNVATSRARAACLLVASPLLLEPDCRTPRQMQLANAFCRYNELARQL
jgi:predicted RecB family nuclease